MLTLTRSSQFFLPSLLLLGIVLDATELGTQLCLICLMHHASFPTALYASCIMSPSPLLLIQLTPDALQVEKPVKRVHFSDDVMEWTVSKSTSYGYSSE